MAPATAKVIGKYAHGISDDLLTATLLATQAPVLVAPAMHTEMWEHAAVQENLATLRERGVHVVDPEAGRLAGGDAGAGRLADPERIVAAAADVLAGAGDLAGLRVLVTAGGTREPIDPVRFVGNRSSGKMGYARRRARRPARRRGHARHHDRAAHRRLRDRRSSGWRRPRTWRDAVLSRFADVDVVVMAAAVADFRPKAVADEKLKKRDGVPEVVLEPTPDILAVLGERKSPGAAARRVRGRDRARRGARGREAGRQAGRPHGRQRRVGRRLPASKSTRTGRSCCTRPVLGEETPLLDKRELADLILDRVAAVLADDPTGAKRGAK